MNVFAIFGGIKVIVPSGSRVTASGLSLFGGRRVKVRQGDGPALRRAGGGGLRPCGRGRAPHAQQPEAAPSEERVFRGETGIKLADVGIQAG